MHRIVRTDHDKVDGDHEATILANKIAGVGIKSRDLITTAVKAETIIRVRWNTRNALEAQLLHRRQYLQRLRLAALNKRLRGEDDKPFRFDREGLQTDVVCEYFVLQSESLQVFLRCCITHSNEWFVLLGSFVESQIQRGCPAVPPGVGGLPVSPVRTRIPHPVFLPLSCNPIKI